MKQPVLAVMAIPTTNKYVIRVYRGDRQHLPQVRDYSALYSDYKRALNLGKRFTALNALLTPILLEQLISTHQVSTSTKENK